MKYDYLLLQFSEKLSSLYSAQHQLLQILPQLAAAASSQVLKDMFSLQFAETREQTVRLEGIAASLGITLSREECGIMEEILFEGKQIVEETSSPALNKVILSLARRAKSVEMRAYGKAVSLAEQLGYKDAAELLEGSLREGYRADGILAKASETEIERDAEALDSAFCHEARQSFGESLGSLLSPPDSGGTSRKKTGNC